MTHETKQVGLQSVCSCGQTCWAYGKSIHEACWGEIHVSEDCPGEYTHFCDGHGHFEAKAPYKLEPVTLQQVFDSIALDYLSGRKY